MKTLPLSHPVPKKNINIKRPNQNLQSSPCRSPESNTATFSKLFAAGSSPSGKAQNRETLDPPPNHPPQHEKKANFETTSDSMPAKELKVEKLDGDWLSPRDFLPTSSIVAAPLHHPPLNIEWLAQQMLRAVTIEQKGNQTTLALEMEMPRFSRLGLNLTLDAGKLNACFNISDRQQWELIRSAIPNLERDLSAKGISLNAVEVALNQPSEQNDHMREPPPPTRENEIRYSSKNDIKPHSYAAISPTTDATDYVA